MYLTTQSYDINVFDGMWIMVKGKTFFFLLVVLSTINFFLSLFSGHSFRLLVLDRIPPPFFFCFLLAVETFLHKV